MRLRCGRSDDGPYVRLPVRNQFGEIWLCGAHQEHVLAANRLMSLRLYEERMAELRAEIAPQVKTARDAMARTTELDQQLASATTQARRRRNGPSLRKRLRPGCVTRSRRRLRC